MLSLIMDAIVAVLLVATIAFAIRLNKRLGMLNSEREAMERLISGLHTASRQAEEAVAELKAAALENGQNLQAIVDKAASLKLDLEFMVDKGSGLADRLEAGIKGERTAAGAPVVVPVLSEVRPGREAGSPADRTASSRLAALLKRADSADTPPARARAHGPSKPKASGEAKKTEADDFEDVKPAIPESRAERELKRALEARR